MKKLISVLIAAVMICSLCIIPAFAATTEETAPTDDFCPAKGDVSNDKTVGAEDARLALRYSVGLEDLDDEALIRADMDNDGEILSADARKILRLSVKLDKAPAHVYVEKTTESTWVTAGADFEECSACHEIITNAVYDTKLHEVIEAANAWAEDTGIAQFISAEDTNGETNEASIELNVDGIWEDMDIDTSVFDGFLTKLGDVIDTYLTAEDTLTIDGNKVFANGKVQNTAVKNALFDIGAGFFYKMANLAEDGVYGTYAVEINGEEIALSVAFTGSEENIEKVKGFCLTISEHISAEIVEGNLVIDVYAPDALKNVIIEKAGEDAKASLDALTLADGFSIVNSLNVEEVFGSQASAVNKLCAFICELSPFVNKVLSKTDAKVELQNGTKLVLNANGFDCNGDNSFSGLVDGFTSALSDELLATTVGAFAVEGEEYYSVPVHVSVDMSSLGLMAGETIEETVILNIHVFDN